jgi:hypothetical protein
MRTLEDLARGSALLARTPRLLDAWLRGLDEETLRRNEGPDTFSPFDVVGHLIHGEETDWMGRARLILEHGEARPFEPFDRFAHVRAPKAATIEGQLELFAVLRARNLAELADLGLRPADFGRTGTHPALGRVTLGNLLSTWVAHDLAHVRQIARVLAEPQRGELGPWAAYIPLFQEPRRGGGA